MRSILLHSFLFLIILFSLPASAQVPAIEWQKCYGGGDGDYAQAIELTSDGGYIIAGVSESAEGDITAPKGAYDIWVVKINNTGIIQWQENFGGRSWDKDHVIIHQTGDGYILGGSTTSTDGDVRNKQSFNMDLWMIKLTSTGVIQWEKTYGGSATDYLGDMQIAADGGYILVGNSESNDRDLTKNNGDRDFWVVKIAATGTLEWQKSFGGSANDEAYTVQVTTDGGYIVAGETESLNGDVIGNHGKRDMWVLKLTGNGNSEWKKCFGGSLFEEATSVRQTADGGYLIAGYAGSNDGDVSGNHISVALGFTDFWVVKTDRNGNIQWQKCYGGGFNEKAFVLELTKDGGFIMAGMSESANGDVTCNRGWEDYWVVKLNETGAIQWQKTMGGYSIEEIFSVKETTDGGYILAGFTSSRSIPGYHRELHDVAGDYWVVKLTAQLFTTPEPSISISIPSTNICAGSPYIFTATAASPEATSIFQWQVNGVTVGANNPVYTTDFTHAGDVVKCIMTVVTDCGTRTLQVESNSITMVGGQDINPEVTTAATATSICSGTSVTFTATNRSGNFNPVFQWSVNGQNVGTNSAIYTTNALTDGATVSCRMTVPQCGGGSTKDDADPIIIKVNSVIHPSIVIETSNTSICKNTNAIFNAKIKDGGANPSYQWEINGVNVGTNNASFSTNNLKDGDEVSCTLFADFGTSGCGSQATTKSNSFKMKVVDEKPAHVTITADNNNVCEGTQIKLSATAENAGISPVYQWEVNGVKSGQNGAYFFSKTLSNGDKITCVLTTQAVCVSNTVSSNVVLIEIKDIPRIEITSSDTIIAAGKQAQIKAIIASNALSYEWLPQAFLINSQSLEPTTIPLEDDITIALMAAAANGCTDKKQIKIAVNRDLYIPNSFTPNHDGLNDIFRIPPRSRFNLKQFSVFDRWGNLVFNTSDILKGWNGEYKGTILPGVYTYIISGNDKKKEILIKGTVLLIK